MLTDSGGLTVTEGKEAVAECRIAPTLHLPQERARRSGGSGPHGLGFARLLGKHAPFEWQQQHQETQPVAWPRLLTAPCSGLFGFYLPDPFLLEAAQPQLEDPEQSQETLSPKPNSSRSLPGKLLHRLSYFCPLPHTTHPNLEPQGHNWLSHPTGRSCPQMLHICPSTPCNAAEASLQATKSGFPTHTSDPVTRHSEA